MNIKNRILYLIDSLILKFPETIYVKPITRKILIIIFYWGGIVNAIVFMFLYVSLYYGYDFFGLKNLIKAQ